jgi:2-hydroxychromene-2-carboxylate isomerase
MRKADWYFDFISPFAYFALTRLPELPTDVAIAYRPLLFAGLLNHWGQKGPAEIPPKRLWTFRWCMWWAQRHGIAFRAPAAHPFNPLQHLRLAIAAGCSPDAVRRIFESVWTTGDDPADPAAFAALAKSLGIDPAQCATPEVKDTLRRNTEEATARGVFGVPTLMIDGQVFWGADGMDFAMDYLADPSILHSEAMRRVDTMQIAASRKNI